MDGRKNNGGARSNSGSKGYGRMLFIQKNIEKYGGLWWDEIGKMMEGESKEDKKFALAEFNKIQIKVIPQEQTGEMTFIVKVEDYGRDKNSTPIKAESISTGS